MTPIPCLNSLASLLSLLGQPVLLGKRHGTAWAKRRGNQESLGYAEKSERAWTTQMETWDSLVYTHTCVYTHHIYANPVLDVGLVKCVDGHFLQLKLYFYLQKL